MKTKSRLAVAMMAAALACAKRDQPAETGKYALKVPGGLAFSEFRGYESWETISLSHSATLIAVIWATRQ